MELRQVVEPSQTASVLQAVASPEVYKQPVLSERFEGALVLPLASEGWSGAETIPAVGIITAAVCTDFYHLYCITPPHPPPQPLSSTFILYPYFLFEGAPTRSLQSS